MEQENKKISFGFSKLSKKPNIFQKPSIKQKDVQLIDCLEAQTIKLKNAVEEIKGPLVIPMVESSGNLLDRRRELKMKRDVKVENNVTEKPDSELTADELAARELIKDAQNTHVKTEGKVFTLPAVTDNVIEIEGKEEPTMEDYESVPISDYGLAMLRGMGWSEGAGIGKSKSSATKVIEPALRPKGMGLGANRGANQEHTEKPAVDKDGKELILKKGAFAKIVDGKQKGNYCEIQGFDDEAGRVIVKTTLKGLVLSLNEFLVRVVTKEEYVKSSKVINNAKYEEYKNKTENEEKLSSNKEKNYTERNSHHSKPKASNSKQRDYTSSGESSEDDRKYENEKHNDKYQHKKKSKKKHRSSSRSGRESSTDRRRYRERARSSSSDHDYKKHSTKNKKKMKSKSKYRDNSDSESDYSYSRNKKSHKSSKQQHKHRGRDR